MMGWTIQQYYDQPIWYIQWLSIKIEEEGIYEAEQNERNTSRKK